MIFQPKNNRDIILSTILFSLSYAPSPFGFLIYFAFIPVIRLSLRLNPRNAFICGYIIGILTSMILLHWIAIFNPWYYSAFIPINALQIAVFMWLISILARRNRLGTILIFPFLWTTIEFVRELGPFAFTWLDIGYTHSKFIYLIQFAEFTGAIGITFWICLINMVFIFIWDNRSRKMQLIFYLSILFLLFLLPLVYGKIVLEKKIQTYGIVAAYAQPSISAQTKWDESFRQKNLFVLLSESQKVRGYHPDLIVWPETALPYYYRRYPRLHKILKSWTQQNNVAVLTGTMNVEGIRNYNAAVLIDGNTNDSLYFYNKIKPVPFAEKAIWPGNQDTMSIYPGTDYTLFQFDVRALRLSYKDHHWKILPTPQKEKEIKCAALICFESAFSSLARQMSEQGADILVILTNDESFSYSSQPFQHLQISRMRAIENRRSLIQCANTGVSAFIDPFGNVYQQSELFTNRVSVQTVPVWKSVTFYTKNGDWIRMVYPGVTILMVLYIFVRFSKIKNV